MSIEIENLSDAVNALTEKLHGIGIEIYHLNDSISSLKNAIRDLRDKED